MGRGVGKRQQLNSVPKGRNLRESRTNHSACLHDSLGQTVEKGHYNV